MMKWTRRRHCPLSLGSKIKSHALMEEKNVIPFKTALTVSLGEDTASTSLEDQLRAQINKSGKKKSHTQESPELVSDQENWVHQDGKHDIVGHITSQGDYSYNQMEWRMETSAIFEFNPEQDRSRLSQSYYENSQSPLKNS